MLQNWPTWNNRDVATEIWACLPYAIIWTVWRIRNAVIFHDAPATAGMAMQNIQSATWQWLNMSLRAMELRENVRFTDLLYGWRYVMIEQW
ncbi:hypothetical protein FRX31_017972 [Thalictrum thalictroides]|uniref:Uncharacterized protein n=1 Tax=Thalictrum thalictroides TaxID=46969 RepID=A0A7J6W5I2_THATH|nr:hypothetical protein FRX31_017972 [Thalictrum thalictroides]